MCNVFTPSFSHFSQAERVKIFGRSVVDFPPDQLSSPTVKISPLTEALEQICLYARIATRGSGDLHYLSVHETENKKTKNRSSCEKHHTYNIHEQTTKAKRIPAAKSLNFTNISGNIISSTPARSNTVGYVATTKVIRTKTIAKQKQQAV